MPQRNRGRAPLLASLAAVVVVSSAAAAWADVTSPLAGAGLLVIKSTGGAVTISVGAPGAVRVVGADGVTLTHFAVSADADGHVILPQQNRAPGVVATPSLASPGPLSPGPLSPRPVAPNAGPGQRLGFGQRSFTVPGLQDGSDGLSLVNKTRGDIVVYVPQTLAALFVMAGPGDVSASGLRSSYVIVTGRGGINLQNFGGRGLLRTWTGPITLNGISGMLGVESARGAVTAREISVSRADVQTQSGDVDWEFSTLGRGGYRFTSRQGNIQVGLAPDAAANVDAQSESGSVVNAFQRPRPNVRNFNRHAISMALRGGGPEITASSKFGRVTIRRHHPF